MASLSQNISGKQFQSLVMTPQLQQSLKMLELSSQELLSYVNQELERNPLLEKGDGRADDVDSAQEGREQKSSVADGGDTYDQSLNTNNQDATNALDTDFSNVWQDKQEQRSTSSRDEAYDSPSFSKAQDFDKMSYLEQTVAEVESLEGQLEEQINLEFEDGVQRLIAFRLLDGLDERGYLDVELSVLADELGCDVQEVADVLVRCQQFSPSGIFARSLPECMEIQLRERNRFDPMMKCLLNNLELIAKAELTKLAKMCGVSHVELCEMVEEIRLLVPYPAREYLSESTQNIVADIFLTKDSEEQWKLELNNDTMPKLLVNNDYYASIKKTTKDKGEISYVTEQFNTANWLIKALQQRQETILKVASQIVLAQEEFLEKGVMHLKPMTLADVAEKIDMHESTVGRVTTNKYITTPRGIFELKYFFSSGVQNAMGEQVVSNKTVKYRIQEMIEQETIDTVLSDDKIAELLKLEGIDIARRTVAKYRESLQIPSSSQRKKQKKLAFSL